MKSNILLICQNTKHQKVVGKSLADELSMFYADLDDIMKYNFIDEKTLQFAGRDYYENEVVKSVKAARDYVNALITVGFDTLNIRDCWFIVKQKCTIIYINEPYEEIDCQENQNKINELVFDDRHDYLLTKADIVVDINKNDQDILNKIFIKMKEYFNLSK